MLEQDGQTLIDEAQIEPQNSIARTEINDIIYDWDISRYVVINVGYRPGSRVFDIGTALLVLSLIGQFVPQQYVWGTIVHSGDSQVIVSVWTRHRGLTLHSSQQLDRIVKTLRTEIERPV